MSGLCPLCQQRKARRACPAQAAEICSICCGSKREVEIDCPPHCSYLRSGRQYESGKKMEQSRDLPADSYQWDEEFLERNSSILSSLNQVVLLVRRDFPEMVDRDVREVLECLKKTYETVEKGIIYDFKPVSSLQLQLFAALKAFLENPTGSKEAAAPQLKTSTILDCLNFLLEMVKKIELPRPKSRAFLDHTGEVFGKSLSSRESSSIILP